MRKTKLLNSKLSTVISEMGHFDTVVIGDAGLPIPPSCERIDLAVTLGIPSFIDVFVVVMEELQVQKATLADEIIEQNPVLYAFLCDYFQTHGIVLELVPHEMLKEKSTSSKAVVRTGECHPYANVILESGVTF